MDASTFARPAPLPDPGAAPARSAQQVRRAVIESAGLRSRLAQLAAARGTAESQLVREAQRYLKELVPHSSAFGYRLLIHFSRFFYQRGYDREILCDAAEVQRLRELLKRHHVALISNHRSQVDGFAIYCALHDQRLPHPFAFGGINMNLPVMGSILRGSGMIFLRRSFQDNPVYKAVVRAYIDYLIDHRLPLLWAIEGTRSRTGKLAAPRFGLMSWVLDTEERPADKETYVVPVAISYEQIADVQAYAAEQRGAKKRPESLRWLLKYLGSFRNPLGPVSVRFGQPVSMQQELAALRQASPDAPPGRDRELLRVVIASCLRLNDATPVTAPSLVCLVLLQAAPKAITGRELEREFDALFAYVRSSGWPDTFGADTPAQALQRALSLLQGNGVVECFDRGVEPVYSIQPDSELPASYYRNNSIHFFVLGAMAELALTTALNERDPAQREAVFWSEIRHLRDIFRFEFYFPQDAELRQRVRSDLDRRSPAWQRVLASPSAFPGREMQDVTPLLCHGVLECFVAAYQVVAARLARCGDSAVDDTSHFIDDCLGEAEQLYRLRRITHPESVAKPMLESGLLVARSRGLLKASGEVASLAERRDAFRAEMDELAARLQRIREISAARREMRSA